MRNILEQLHKDVLAIKAKIIALTHPSTQVIECDLDAMSKVLSDLTEADEGQQSEVADLIKTLTPREHQVAMCLKDGMCNKEIADATGLSTRTVKSHLNTVYEKLKVRDRLQAALVLQQV